MAGMKLPPPPTRSTITTTASAGSHELKVEGYSVTKLLVDGEHIESSKFKAAGHDFQICYYPNKCCCNIGKDCNAGRISAPPGAQMLHAGSNATISFFLKLAGGSKGKDVRAEFRFSLVPRHGGEPAAPGAPAKVRFAGERHVVTFPRKHNGVEYWGLKISKKELEKSSEYLWDDSFVVRCEISVVEKQIMRSHDFTVCRCKDDLCKRRHMTGASLVKDVIVNYFLRCIGI
ncbi:hypothetical protein VPH35_125008 [Triticum aestivum]